MPQTISPEGAADSEGPNASMELGKAGEAQDAANSLKSTNPAAYAGSQEPGQGAAAGAPPPTPSVPQGQPPTQAPPMPEPPQGANVDAMFPNLDEGQPWRARLNVWAKPEHPYLTHFANMANRDAKRHARG